MKVVDRIVQDINDIDKLFDKITIAFSRDYLQIHHIIVKNSREEINNTFLQ